VRTPIIVLFASLLPVVLLGQEKEKKVDPCTLLTAADAASIAGKPMWFVHGDRKSCEYIDRKPAILSGTQFEHSVTLEIKRYKSAEVRDKEWAKATAVQDQGKDSNSFKAARQVLSGIGDEAYLFGHIQDGRVGIAQIYVRKGTLIFKLDNFVITDTSSLDAFTAVAKKIADQL
jgi:hypothetical protein